MSSCSSRTWGPYSPIVECRVQVNEQHEPACGWIADNPVAPQMWLARDREVHLSASPSFWQERD